MAYVPHEMSCVSGGGVTDMLPISLLGVSILFSVLLSRLLRSLIESSLYFEYSSSWLQHGTNDQAVCTPPQKQALSTGDQSFSRLALIYKATKRISRIKNEKSDRGLIFVFMANNREPTGSDTRCPIVQASQREAHSVGLGCEWR